MSKTILVIQISYAELSATRSRVDELSDLELSLILLNNNLHAAVSPLAVFGIAEDQFVIAIKSSATLDSNLISIYSPLPVIRAFVASNFDAESSLHFDFGESSSILAPFEIVWELSGGANQE